MRRAVILATLICILFAVAGVTVAGENTFTSSSRDGDQTESTVAGRTAPEATVPETTVPEEVEKPVDGTEEAAVVVHEEPKEPGRGDPDAGNYGGIQDGNSIEKVVEKPQRAERQEIRQTASRGQAARQEQARHWQTRPRRREGV